MCSKQASLGQPLGEVEIAGFLLKPGVVKLEVGGSVRPKRKEARSCVLTEADRLHFVGLFSILHQLKPVSRPLRKITALVPVENSHKASKALIKKKVNTVPKLYL